MLRQLWTDRTPSKRCDWIDQLRGWAVIVMMEVHVANVWLLKGLLPGWLSYVNGLVAPSFILCAGYSLVLSTFRPDGSLRPFWPETARRLGFILVCAYLLHAPGITLAAWTVLSTTQKFRVLCQIDVLQCIVYSLLILQGLARLTRRPARFAILGFTMTVAVAWASPYLWRHTVADDLWMPVRGLINGNVDRGVRSLFPLFPWFSFAALGSVLGVLYRHFRVMPVAEKRARWSEGQWLLFLSAQGLAAAVWGTLESHTWLGGALWRAENLASLHNTTLPSVAQRAGVVCVAGALMSLIEALRPRLPGPNPVAAASRESLLVYMLHLTLIFSVLLSNPVRKALGLEWHSFGWPGTLTMVAAVIAFNLGAAVLWQWVRRDTQLMRKWRRRGLKLLGIWFLVGGWYSFQHFVRSPELAMEPYPFLNAARVRKGLSPTPDGLCRDPEEYFREAARREIEIDDQERAAIRDQILARHSP
ncbi:MAG: heparan-alpha-glucosaminide N-acetyltransferase domain-containing protein [Acidobacteriota bacterium]